MGDGERDEGRKKEGRRGRGRVGRCIYVYMLDGCI
jgi:hypothetical protein